MLSRRAIGVWQESHADGGWTIDRPSGRRAATTLRKLPTAIPGTKTTSAAPTFTPRPAYGSGSSTNASREPRGVSEHDVVLELVAAACSCRIDVDRKVDAELRLQTASCRTEAGEDKVGREVIGLLHA